MQDLYIGLMSGTSADGIDAALVDFSNGTINLIATDYTPYPSALRAKILALCKKGADEIQRLGELDVVLGKEFAQAANRLLEKNHIERQTIKAIGSHGQTIRHAPRFTYPFTLQIGDPNTITIETGITTVADFRRKDVALGGQGAPLVPAFHQHVFASDHINRAVVNIGGMANVTLLPQGNPQPVLGFDIGPGNVLLDSWVQHHLGLSHDKNGAWGATGKVNPALLALFLSDPYFAMIAPKSTGREHFHLNWIREHIQTHATELSSEDIQATLVELTALSILQAITPHFAQGEILICGGGAHNQFLMQRLNHLAQANFHVASTELLGINPDWVEAMAFAWLAQQTINRQPGNLPSVTGAKAAAVLGGVYYH